MRKNDHKILINLADLPCKQKTNKQTNKQTEDFGNGSDFRFSMV